MILSVLSGFILLFFFFWFYVPRLIVRIDSFQFDAFKGDIEQTLTELMLYWKHFELKTHDNLTINGYQIKTNQDYEKATIIFVHGIRTTKEAFIQRCSDLSQLGYNCVLYDLRAHAKSEGTYCTFGYYEKQDLKTIIDYVDKNTNTNNIGVWGQSLGGAIILQTMAIEPRINFGIIESTFADLSQINHDYIYRRYGINCRWLSDFLLWRGAAMASFNDNEVRPCESAKQITAPTLFVHGTNDYKIKIAYNRLNYANAASQHKQFIPITGGTHHNIWKLGGEGYFKDVLRFIDKALANTLLNYE